MGKLTKAPLNCLLCLKSIKIHKPLKWKDDDFIDGFSTTCSTSVNSQLRVIFLLRKLLEIPSDVCVGFLQSYGDPCFWITYCDSCSVLVDQGRQIYSQIVQLQKQLDIVQENLKTSIFKSGKLNCDNGTQGATHIVRSFIKNELKAENAQGENKCSGVEVGQSELELHCSALESLDLQIGNTLGTALDEDILDVNSDSEIMIKIENTFDNSDNNSNSHEFNSDAEVITGDLDTFACEICGKAFSESDALMNHLRNHTGGKPYKCDICGKEFARPYKLGEHILTHTGEKPFECDICRKGFSQSGTLKRHRRTHTGEKAYVCEICELRFSQYSSLKSHLLTHTGEKPFACDICKRGFQRSFELKNHIRIHTGEKPYKCEMCGNAFSLLSTLKSHIRTHTGEKPFECDICGKGFSDRRTVKRHLCTPTGEKP